MRYQAPKRYIRRRQPVSATWPDGRGGCRGASTATGRSLSRRSRSVWALGSERPSSGREPRQKRSRHARTARTSEEPACLRTKQPVVRTDRRERELAANQGAAPRARAPWPSRERSLVGLGPGQPLPSRRRSGSVDPGTTCDAKRGVSGSRSINCNLPSVPAGTQESGSRALPVSITFDRRIECAARDSGVGAVASHHGVPCLGSSGSQVHLGIERHAQACQRIEVDSTGATLDLLDGRLAGA